MGDLIRTIKTHKKLVRSAILIVLVMFFIEDFVSGIVLGFFGALQKNLGNPDTALVIVIYKDEKVCISVVKKQG